MSILMIILWVIVGIIVLILLIAACIKKDYAVERNVTINRSKQDVFNYIKYLKNQNSYSKWAKMDPAMTTNFIGTDAAPGFISSWDSKQKNVGKGEQEIKKIIEGERMETEIRFEKPFKSTSPSYMSVEPAGTNQTLVRWGFKGTMPYPFNAMQLFMNMEKMIGKDLQIGLDNLKQLQEQS